MLNQCNFIGRLGSDPEARQTPSGKTVTNFRIAVSEKRGGNENTEWVSVICWEKTAEFVANYTRKGNQCFVSGRMQTRKWKDQQGNDRYTTEIIAQTVQNLSPRSSEQGPPAPQDEPGYGGTGSDVPF